MEKGNNTGSTELIMKATGEMEFYKEKVFSIILMETVIVGLFIKTEQMAMAYINTRMANYIRDIGKMISIMERAEKSFQMAQHTKEALSMVKEKVMGSTNALMTTQSIWVTGKIT